jgi:RHS repeat-associated protein
MWTWFSDPFGTDAANANPAGAGVFAYNVRFAGQAFDGQAGLHQNYYRDYDPAVGQYVESDPIGLEGGINTYAYVQSDPISLADSLGLKLDFGGYVFSNPDVLINLSLLDSLIVGTGVDDECFTLPVTGDDRYRNTVDPHMIQSASNKPVIRNASPHSPHLDERGARAVDFVIHNSKRCDCKPVTDDLVNSLLRATFFSTGDTARDYPDGPHTHINLPNRPIYNPGRR